MSTTDVVDRIVGPTAGLRAAGHGPEVGVEIVVPVHNEAAALEGSILRLRRYLDEQFPFAATVTIADNASTDGTWDLAARLARSTAGVRAVHLAEKGRGRALRAVWSASPAAIVAYMDVDLSTDLAALLPLIAPLASGHSDLAIGSRLAPGSRVARGPKRELISRSYNLVIRAAVGRHFSDAQCGFKAMTARAARLLLAGVEDDGWFFDTELLLAASGAGLRIHEVAVDWDDDLDSRVDVLATAWADLRGLVRVARGRMARRAAAAGAWIAVAVTGALAFGPSFAAPVSGAIGMALAAVASGAFAAGRAARRVRSRAVALQRRAPGAGLAVVGPPKARAS